MRTTVLFVFLTLFGALQELRSQDITLDETNLELLLQVCAETKADKVFVLFQDDIITRWENPACDSVYMNTASMVKSWAALAIGVLLDQGKIESIDDQVCKYIPDWEAGCTNGVTIRHLMSMSAGILKRPAAESVLVQQDMNAYVTSIELDTLPGVKWSYSNESVQLLAVLIENAAGMPAENFYQEYLFEPLGMDSTSLYVDEAGNSVLFGGCQTTMEDVSCIAQLMLNRGKLDGEKFLSEAWIDEITSPAETNAYYGLLWWLDEANGNYAAMGDFGQMIIVFPEKQLAFVRQQSCSNQSPADNMRWMGPKFLELLGSVVEQR